MFVEIEIDQNIPSTLLTKVHTGDSESSGLTKKCYANIDSANYESNQDTKIGNYPNGVRGSEVFFTPNGLSIAPFIEKNDIDSYRNFIDRINKFLNNDKKSIYKEALKIEEINAIQIITIKKI